MKKIAVITAPEDDVSIGKLRYEGYKKALSDHGIAYNERLVRRMKEDIDSYSMENGYAVTKELLESGKSLPLFSPYQIVWPSALVKPYLKQASEFLKITLWQVMTDWIFPSIIILLSLPSNSQW